MWDTNYEKTNAKPRTNDDEISVAALEYRQPFHGKLGGKGAVHYAVGARVQGAGSISTHSSRSASTHGLLRTTDAPRGAAG